MRILANSVSGQAAEPAATVAGRIGGHDTPTGGGQRAGRVRLGGDLSANGGSGRLRDVNDNRHPRGDGGPQANRPALSRRPAWRSVHEPADPRAVWTERIALAPSPTAAATRFIDPDRTSPTAKTSGWLVSNGSGRRPSSAQVAPSDAPSSWVPVSTKPSSSTAMSSSQPVAGVAPIKQNRPRHGWLLPDRSSPGAAVCTVMASRWPPPCSAVTSVAVRTVIPA